MNRPIAALIELKPSVDQPDISLDVVIDWPSFQFDEIAVNTKYLRSKPGCLDLKTRLSLRCFLLC